MQKIGDVVKQFKFDDRDKYVSREFQKYGYDLANELEVPEMTSFYIKLAKNTPRGLMEKARSFVKDAQNVRSKSRLFVWKLEQLKKEVDSRQKKI